MTETLLVVNAGSSSIKFQLFGVLPGDRLDLRFKGQMEGIATPPRLDLACRSSSHPADSTPPASLYSGRYGGVA